MYEEQLFHNANIHCNLCFIIMILLAFLKVRDTYIDYNMSFCILFTIPSVLKIRVSFYHSLFYARIKAENSISWVGLEGCSCQD